MRITKQQWLKVAVDAGLDDSKSNELWEALGRSGAGGASATFQPAHVAYYLGATLVIGAMGWFMNESWEAFGGWGLTLLSMTYASLFVLTGVGLWKTPVTRMPGGLLFTMAVSMVPLGVYGIERALGVWPVSDPGSFSKFHPWVNGSWIVMEAATVIAGIIALRFWRFPFLTAPIAWALWYMSMDIAPFLIGRDSYDWHFSAQVSVAFGSCMIVASYCADLFEKDADLAFWGYFFGVIAFWGGLSCQYGDSEWKRLAYCAINLGLMFLSLALRRRVFMVFGALGLNGYLAHLSYSVFSGSVWFPFILTLLGLAIIILGVQYQKRRRQLQLSFTRVVVPYFRRLIPARALAELEE